MKRMLIKIVLILSVVFVSSTLSSNYSNYLVSTFDYNLSIVLLFRIIPGFLCGLILGYELILQFAKDKLGKFDVQYLILSLFLIGLILSPYLIYEIPFTLHASVMPFYRTMMSNSFGVMASLLAGYCFTQSFAIKN